MKDYFLEGKNCLLLMFKYNHDHSLGVFSKEINIAWAWGGGESKILILP